MKKTGKRIMAAAVALSVLVLSGVTAFASISGNEMDKSSVGGENILPLEKATFPGWSAATAAIGGTEFNQAAIAEIRSKAGYNGGNAMYLSSKHESTAEADIWVYSESVGFLYGGTYEISFKFKFEDYAKDTTENLRGTNKVDVKTGEIETPTFDVPFGINGGQSMQGRDSWGASTITDLGDGWYQAVYQRTITHTTTASAIKNGNKYRYLKLRAGNTLDDNGYAVYVDDVGLARVAEDGTALNENLIYNGDFEVTEATGVARSEYDASDVVVGEYASALALSWVNPANESLTKVELYDITDESNVTKVDAALSATPGERVRHSVSGLTDGGIYYYKAVFTFSDGRMSETILAGHAGSQNRTPLTTNKSWEIETTGTDSAETRLYNIEIDNDIKHSGDASVRISTGYNATEEAAFANGAKLTSTKITKPWTILGSSPLAADDEGYKYGLFSCWVKTDGVGYYKVSFGGETLGEKNTTAAVKDNDEMYGIKGRIRTNDWTYFEGIIKYKEGNANHSFSVQTLGSQIKNLWVDDIAFYPCDASGVIPAGAASLIAAEDYDAGLEHSSDALEAILANAPSEVSATAGNGYVTVSWKDDMYPPTSQNQMTHKKIYFINEDGEYIYKGKAYKGKTSFTFENLENDKTYKIAVVNSARFGGSSPATIVEATTVAPDYEIGEFELYSGSDELDAVQTGTLTAKINIANNKIAEGLDAVLIVAVYGSDNGLKHVYFAEGSSDGKIAKGNKETLTVNGITVESGDKLKTFLWDSMVDIGVYKPMKQW